MDFLERDDSDITGTVPLLSPDLLHQIYKSTHASWMNKMIFETPVEAIVNENLQEEYFGTDEHGFLYTERHIPEKVGADATIGDIKTYKLEVQKLFEMFATF